MIISQVILMAMMASSGGYSTVTFQEFKTMEQCQYAAKLIRESATYIRSIQCINK